MTAADKLYAGIDIGGTKILVLIADADGTILGRARVPTQASHGPDAVIARIADTVHAAAKDAGIDMSRITSGGVSAPGPIDLIEGTITDPPNLPGWHNVPLAKLLHHKLAIRMLLENDANCAAVGEHDFGAGRGYKHMIYITISTGIGAGIIIDDELYIGASGAAGEVGHMGIAATGPMCGAGHPGCLEAVAAGSGIAARAREQIAAGGMVRTARLAEQNPPLSAKTVFMAAEQGEAEAMALIESAGHYIGMALATLINAFNPQAIVIGGGLTNMGETILGPAVETARQRAFGQSFNDVRIVEAELGDDVAALGAIAVAQHRVTNVSI